MSGRRIQQSYGNAFAESLLPGRNRRERSDIRDVALWDQAPLWALGAIRRIMARSTLGQSLIRQYLVHVVGPHGPQPVFKEIPSKRDREALERFWKEWSRHPTASGRESWSQFLRQMVHSRTTDGRVFAIVRRHNDYKFGSALTPLTRDWLFGWGLHGSDHKVMYMGEDLDVTDGIARAPSGRIKAYQFYQDYKQAYRTQSVASYGFYTWQELPSGGPVMVDANNVLDHFTPISPNDFHGTPGPMIPLVRLLQQIDDLDDYTLKAMHNASLKAGFIKQLVGSPAIDWNDKEAMLPPDEVNETLLEYLPEGHEYQGLDLKAPNANMVMYRDTLTKNAAAAAGVNHASLTGDLSGVNFSSTRHGELQARDSFRLAQRDLERDVCHPAFMAAIETAWMTGKLSISMKTLDTLKSTEWRGRSWSWVDPQRDASASSKLLEMGATSPQAICSGLGADFETVIEEIKQAKEFMEKAGLTPADLQAFAGSGDFAGEVDEMERKESEERMKEMEEMNQKPPMDEE